MVHGMCNGMVNLLPPFQASMVVNERHQNDTDLSHRGAVRLNSLASIMHYEILTREML